jgi:hypothetical protein
MDRTLRLLFLLAVAFPSTYLHAAPIDALTGTYTGTIIREHRITRETNPERVVKFKQITRVGGFGYVPAGADRTLIRLIVPLRNMEDIAADRTILIDFQADPPTVQVISGSATTPVVSPTVTVSGKTVTVEVFASFSDTRANTEETCKMKLTRTKPDPAP